MIQVMEVLSNGRLGLSLGFPNEEAFSLNMAGKDYVSGEYDQSLYYVADSVVQPRPVMPIIVDGVTLTGLPIPAIVIIGTELYEVDDGDVELDFPLPGTYRVRVEAWPYQEWEMDIEVTA